MPAFLTAFALVFLAELPDKTALTVVLLASRNPALPVLLGAWTAFAAQGLIAVALGSALAQFPPAVVRGTAALVFAVFGVLLLVREEKPEEKEGMPGRPFVASFVLVFLAEFGDATQLASAALVARLGAPVQVFLGATLALCTVAALAVTVGRTLGPRLPARALRRAAGVLFLAFAAWTFFRH